MDNEIFLEIRELLQQLVKLAENLNSSPSWDTIIAFFALIAAWITIAFLLIERHEKNRPYLQISFELVRSTLACIVLKNTGDCPLKIKSLEFSDNFTKQLSSNVQERLNEKIKTDIDIFPNRQWVISFDVNVFDIINKFEEKKVEISYIYSKVGKCKRQHIGKTTIDYEEYRGILDYISDLDEFKKSVDKLNKTVNKFIDVSKLEDDTVAKISE